MPYFYEDEGQDEYIDCHMIEILANAAGARLLCSMLMEGDWESCTSVPDCCEWSDEQFSCVSIIEDAACIVNSGASCVAFEVEVDGEDYGNATGFETDMWMDEDFGEDYEIDEGTLGCFCDSLLPHLCMNFEPCCIFDYETEVCHTGDTDC